MARPTGRWNYVLLHALTFCMKGSGELDNGMTAGVNIELGVLSSGTSSGTTTRHATVDLSGAFGKLTLGHTSEAADGMAHADNALNGGSWLGGVTNWCSYVTDIGRDSSPACPSNNGGHRDVLRYDTPALGPASIAVSTADDERWSTQLKVVGSAGDAGYDFRIGYIGEYDNPKDAVPTGTTDYTRAELVKAFDLDEDATNADISAAVEEKYDEREWEWASRDGDLYRVTVGGTPATTEKAGDILTTSVAVSFGQGTSVGAAWSRNDMPNHPTKEHEYTFLAVDHSYGDGSVGVYWKRGETSDSIPGNADVEGTLWGVGLGHNIGGGATAYAGFRRIEEDNEDDINLYLAGMRVTFN